MYICYNNILISHMLKKLYAVQVSYKHSMTNTGVFIRSIALYHYGN